MSAFKDFIAADVKNTFINPNEFADCHEIDGEKVNCVIDSDVFSEHSNKSIEGVFVNAITIYVASDSFEVPPVEGQLLTVDSVRYFVRSVCNEMGILTIIAEVNEQ